MSFSENLLQLKKQAMAQAAPMFAHIDSIAEANTLKVLDAMRECQVSEAHFNTTSGYAYDDIGRSKIEELFAKVFGAERALVRTNFVSGTHALATVLFGILRPGDKLVSITGAPYDTMQTVIGYANESPGSLKEFGVLYDELDMIDGKVDMAGIAGKITPDTKMVLIQRSRGYSMRNPLTIEEIGAICQEVKKVKPDCICFVDNCYGEFVETIEPTDVGADMIVGSLIKNPGGGLAPIGGYIAGTRQCIENAAYRLGSPGLGREVGASLGVNQSFFQGLFLAPTVVSGALKGAIFAANVYERLGFDVVPNSTEPRYDIIQAITFGKPEGVIAFCQGIQAAAPVDSYVSPEPWDMPGYDSQVIMAAGAFIQGSSIELSADGPIKPPYSVFFQGGLTWYHAKLGILMSLQKLLDAGIVKPEQLKID